MDATILYLGYCQLGPQDFLAHARPALVLRGTVDEATRSSKADPRAIDPLAFDPAATHAAAGVRTGEGGTLHIHPLTKKPGSPFPEMITVGRTQNNDICIPDGSVSRFHMYFRDSDSGWLVCDAGSKNGTSLEGRGLATRIETPLPSVAIVQIGDILTTFYTPAALYDLLLPLTTPDA